MNYQLHKQGFIKPSKKSTFLIAVAISPDCDYALSSGIDFSLCMWDFRTRACTHSWEPGRPLNAITIHSSGKWAPISTIIGALLWDKPRLHFKRFYLPHIGGTEDISYSERLGMVIGAGEDSLIYRWDFETAGKHKPLNGHIYPVTRLVISNGGNLRRII